MKKILFTTLLLLGLFFFLPGKVLADCRISVSTAMVGKPTTIVFSNLKSDTYDLEIGLVSLKSYHASGGVISYNMTFTNPGQYDVYARSVSGLPDTCLSTISVLPAAAPSGNDLKPPKDWLPWVTLPFGPPSFLGISFFQSNLVSFLISTALFLVIVLSLIFIIIGGIMLMTSGGDKEGTAKAKNTITYALLGLALGLGSFIILGVLGNFLGLTF